MRPPSPRSLELARSTTLFVAALALILVARPAFAAALDATPTEVASTLRGQEDLDRSTARVLATPRPSARDDPVGDAAIADMGLSPGVRTERLQESPSPADPSREATPSRETPTLANATLDLTQVPLLRARADSYVETGTPSVEFRWMNESSDTRPPSPKGTWEDTRDTAHAQARGEAGRENDPTALLEPGAARPAARASPQDGDGDPTHYDIKTTTRKSPSVPRADPRELIAFAAAGAVAVAFGLAALLPFALYNRLSGHRLLEHATRRRVYDAVDARPGISATLAARETGVTYSTAVYHLDRLVRAGIVVVTGAGTRVRYYRNGVGMNARAREIATLLENTGIRRVLDSIEQDPGTYRAAIVSRLGVSAATVNWHLKRLIAMGVVKERADGRTSRLYANETSPAGIDGRDRHEGTPTQ